MCSTTVSVAPGSTVTWPRFASARKPSGSAACHVTLALLLPARLEISNRRTAVPPAAMRTSAPAELKTAAVAGGNESGVIAYDGGAEFKLLPHCSLEFAPTAMSRRNVPRMGSDTQALLLGRPSTRTEAMY